jgi:TolB-like protein
MGDGILLTFTSAVDAVECAIAIQKGLAERNRDLSEDRRLIMRVGLNTGEAIVEGDDLFGDVINVAARLETLAEPGGICLSGSVHDQVRRKVKVKVVDLGLQNLKNISEPVRVYRVHLGQSVTKRDEAHGGLPLPLPARPSIAVLPFATSRNDPEQEHFADGLAEDLITDLSRNAGLFVIARHSSLAYKDKFVDARQIARELGVRYLLEGSARRAAGRVRINAQLIDALDGGHVWAERYDRGLDDIFAVQDEVVGSIVSALVGQLTSPPARKRPSSLEAYDLCVRGRALVAQSPAAAQEARLLLERAIELDPKYAEAYRWLAFYLWESWLVWGELGEPRRAEAVSLAEKAVALDPIDPGNRCVLGYLLAYEGRWEDSQNEFESALALDMNNAEAWVMMSDLSVLRGRPQDALEQIRKAFRLNPQPPGRYYWLLGNAQYAARDYERAAETLRKDATYRTGSRRVLAASLAQLGRLDEARREAELFMISNPHFTACRWVSYHPFADEATRQHFVDGYRKAGLPE